MEEKDYTPNGLDKAGDIFSMHGDFIRTVIDLHIQDKNMVEDLYQDFFVYLAGKDIPGEITSMKGFLYKMIIDYIDDSFRRIRCYQQKMREYGKYFANADFYIQPDVASEEADKLFSMIEKLLWPCEAVALTLRFRDGCDFEEAAKRMGVKQVTVRNYTHTGLKKLFGVFAKRKGGKKC